MITLRGVRKAYGDHVVLDGLDLDLPEGRVTAVTGRNGCGKTTLTRLLLGLTAPDAGVIQGLEGRRRAAVFQEDRLCAGLSARDNVALVLGRARRPSVVDELRRVGLDGAALTRPVGLLSGGQRRRVAIVRGVLAEAGLVVLDEPFTGLDVESRPAVMAYVRERLAGRTTLLVTHDVAEAEALGAHVLDLGRRPFVNAAIPQVGHLHHFSTASAPEVLP